LTKKEGKAQSKKDRETKKEIDIVKYTYKHDCGICYLYENSTSNLLLEETVNFKVHTNLRIVGNEEGNDKVAVKVGPGETQFIQLQEIKDGWKLSTGISYLIREV